MSAPRIRPATHAADSDGEVYELIAGLFEISAEQLNLDTSFADDLGADSLDMLALITALEDRCRRRISDEAATEMKTVRDVLAWQKTGARRQSVTA